MKAVIETLDRASVPKKKRSVKDLASDVKALGTKAIFDVLSNLDAATVAKLQTLVAVAKHAALGSDTEYDGEYRAEDRR